HSSDYSIICEYQAEYRGYVRYYQLAENIAWLNALHWIMRTSLLKTLAHKHKSSVTKMARRFRARVATPYGPRTCLETRVPRVGREPLIARFGGLPLRVRLTVDFEDPLLIRKRQGGTELLQRLLAKECEACGSTENVEVHHVRKLADLHRQGSKPLPDWV